MERIVEVDIHNVQEAGLVHSKSWIASHQDVCTEDFLSAHNPAHQAQWILSEMEKGSRYFMLLVPEPVGVISIRKAQIEHLYIVPEAQNKGYGSKLLEYAETQTEGTPELWVRSTNEGAIRFYQRHGYIFSGRRHTMRDGVMLIEEMRKSESL